MSYLPVQRLLEETGHLAGRASVRRCARDTSMYANVHCPKGTYKLPEADFYTSCAPFNRSCWAAAGHPCVCQPCRVLPPHPIEIYAVGLGAVSQGEPCKKMHTCSSVRQRQRFSYRMVRGPRSPRIPHVRTRLFFKKVFPPRPSPLFSLSPPTLQVPLR